MCHIQKNGQQLEKCVILREMCNSQKMCHNQKNGSELENCGTEKCVTCSILCQSQKNTSVRKMYHSQKNVLTLETQATIRKMCHSYQTVSQLGYSYKWRSWVLPGACLSECRIIIHRGCVRRARAPAALRRHGLVRRAVSLERQRDSLWFGAFNPAAHQRRLKVSALLRALPGPGRARVVQAKASYLLDLRSGKATR